MNIRSFRLRLLAVIVVAFSLGACAINEPVGHVPFDQYRKFSDTDYEKYQTEINGLAAAKLKYDADQNLLLTAGLPVLFTEGDVKLTKVWDKSTRRISIYEGYTTGALDSKSNLVLQLMSKADSPDAYIHKNPQTGRDEYVVLAGDVSNQATLASRVLQSTFGIVTAGANGYWAAKASDCDGCGAITLVNQGGNNTASAASNSEASSAADLNAVFGHSCPSGACPEIGIE